MEMGNNYQSMVVGISVEGLKTNGTQTVFIDMNSRLKGFTIFQKNNENSCNLNISV